MEIRHDRDLAKFRDRLVNLRRLERHVKKVFEYWSMNEPGLLSYLDADIHKIEEEIQLYLRKKENKKQFLFDLDTANLLGNLDRVGVALVQARAHIGWSQKELSLAVSISHQQISKYESENYCNVALPTAQRIATVLLFEAEKKQITAEIPINGMNDEPKQRTEVAPELDSA